MTSTTGLGEDLHVTQLLKLVDAIPAMMGHLGWSRCCPKALQGDRAYAQVGFL